MLRLNFSARDPTGARHPRGCPWGLRRQRSTCECQQISYDDSHGGNACQRDSQQQRWGVVPTIMRNPSGSVRSATSPRPFWSEMWRTPQSTPSSHVPIAHRVALPRPARLPVFLLALFRAVGALLALAPAERVSQGIKAECAVPAAVTGLHLGQAFAHGDAKVRLSLWFSVLPRSASPKVNKPRTTRKVNLHDIRESSEI